MTFLGAPDSMDTVETVYDPSVPIDNDESEETTDDDENINEMEHDGADADKKYRVVEGAKKKKKVRFIDETNAESAINSLPSSLKIDGNVRLNHSIKMALKKHKKQKKKTGNPLFISYQVMYISSVSIKKNSNFQHCAPKSWRIRYLTRWAIRIWTMILVFSTNDDRYENVKILLSYYYCCFCYC